MNSMSQRRPGPNPASEELSQLVAQAQAGDRQALEQLVAKTTPMARRIVASVLHRDQIDDAVQESYILVLRKLRQLRQVEAFKGWFSRIVLNVCHRVHRTSKHTEELSDSLVDDSQSEHVLNALALRQALARLSSKDRDILLLREMLGLSYEELSYALRVPVGTVRSRLSSARKRLKESWMA